MKEVEQIKNQWLVDVGKAIIQQTEGLVTASDVAHELEDAWACHTPADEVLDFVLERDDTGMLAGILEDAGV